MIDLRNLTMICAFLNGADACTIVLQNGAGPALKCATIFLLIILYRTPNVRFREERPTVDNPLSFQEVLLRLQSFWADYGCTIWQPYNLQVGAGTMNPATFLRVLGPEPWNVAYVEPSVRPDDGRYGDNPNRMQYYYQYQVILKPDPGNPQEIYLASLEALGIDRRQHDIRFVEDNWEQPAVGAWGLGWEVWLDGQEITQFTYFQQMGGQPLSPVSVEITYGVERIALALQGVDSAWDIKWDPHSDLTYGDIYQRSEWEHCVYYFELADAEQLSQVYDTYEAQASKALDHDSPLVLPAHDYVLKMSHTFNVLDTRGAIGVVERAEYFKRMQRLAARVASAYVAQREELGHPMLPTDWQVDEESGTILGPERAVPESVTSKYPSRAVPYVLEIGVEELPAHEVDNAIAQLEELVPAKLDEARIDYKSVYVGGTPRRLVVLIDNVAPDQRAEERIERGPPTRVAFDNDGKPTKAAEGFANKFGLSADALARREIDGGEYVIALIRDEGRPPADVLGEIMPELIKSISFGKAMRWNWSEVGFSRPIRWYVSLLGSAIVPFSYADVHADRLSFGTRPMGSPEVRITSAQSYLELINRQGIIIHPDERRTEIELQINGLAHEVGGRIMFDPDLLDEVTNLVEQPTVFRGSFSEDFLELPDAVLTTVMRKHQRYFAMVDDKGNLMPYFVGVRNGDDEHLDMVIKGNEHVIRARFADARFFYNEDIKHSLEHYVGELKTLTFQETLGSYYEKIVRLEGFTARLGTRVGLNDDEIDQAIRSARLSKADLTTQMVVEMTSLQGEMGRHYALRSYEAESIATAIAEHYLPRFAGDRLPETTIGLAVA
ncbi:MAG: glycine--tRNA ligase subunit beta, partial [Chloroflexi bacterium]|nr:glycine--tRNA ligase subunit beta [Chloroflexota bacterium]